jgi:4-hydroxy-tetrahydrodipicolinate reductase
MSSVEATSPAIMPTRERARVMLVGLGAIGLAAATSLLQRGDCDVVGAIEMKPSMVGQDLGHVLDRPEMNVPIERRIEDFSSGHANVALVATTSRLQDLEVVIAPLLEREINVVSICEELAYPWSTHEAIARRLDRLARQHDVSVLGTGCNPGFLLDTLPIALSSMTQRVSRVEMRRTAEMSGYSAILKKFGLGLTVEEFNTEQLAGTVVGHVGFEEAIGALADGLGWTLDEIEIDPVRPAFVSPRERRGVHVTVPAGTVTAVTHSARARHGNRTVISLDINFGIFEAGDPIDFGDRILLYGEEQDVEVVAHRGFDSFLSTVAMATNVITDTLHAPSGLLTMGDLPVRAMAAKGARRSVAGVNASRDTGQRNGPRSTTSVG